MCLVGVLLITPVGCDRDVTVGREDALAANGGDSGGGDPSALLWSADHETASFDEWLGDGDGIQYEQRTGQLSVTTERAHGGTHAFTASITTDDGELQQA